jgi:malonyl-CoA/methylmalonyl-CoA synthetase
MDRWKSITGQTLLERYGMTEIGMALSNPYHGERRPGHVGQPLPGVEIRLADSAGRTITDDSPGEIQVKGAAVFLEYWGREKATKDAFTADGWFKTGDIARLNKGSYKILGRDSVDIIKSGGYKISALEIEDVLRKHPQISDCAVVGIPDETWGEVVSAFLVGNVPEISAEEVSEWAAQFLPAYQLPRKFVQLDELPRNVLGKVTKNVLREGGS